MAIWSTPTLSRFEALPSDEVSVDVGGRVDGVSAIAPISAAGGSRRPSGNRRRFSRDADKFIGLDTQFIGKPSRPAIPRRAAIENQPI